MIHSPNLGGNAFYLACHAALLAPQIFLGVRHKTWGFLFGMFCGHVLEVLGYAARVHMHNGGTGFLLNIVTLTIGPAFFSASIYLCLARIISVYGRCHSRVPPRVYTITFMIFDFFALVLQAAGGSILGGNDRSSISTGLAIMKAGLAVHLVAICVFVGLASEFAWTVSHRRGQWNPEFKDLQSSRKFARFLIALTIATVCILIRTSFRVAELSNGLNSKLANNEVALMILEGAMVVIATMCLAAYHPGVSFEGRWADANFSMRGKKEYEMEDA